MDAFPRRARPASSQTGHSAPFTLTPSQVQDLFASHLDDICARFDEWAFPLSVVGQLGDVAPNTYRKHYQLPLIDLHNGSTISLEASKNTLANADLRPGDRVRLTGALRARLYRGQVTLRFEVLAAEAHDVVVQQIERVQRSVIDTLRDLPWTFHPYPEQREARIALIHSAASNALVAEDFLQALGGGWRPERVRTLPTAMNDPTRIAEAISSVREEILVVVRGGGEASEFGVFEHPFVLEALSGSSAHRVLGVGHSANRTLAERMVDHTATTPARAGHYIRRMSGRLWQGQEEARAQQEELAALRESITALAGVSSRPPFSLRLRNSALLLLVGGLAGLLLSRLF